MRMLLSVAHAACLEAVRKYAAELGAAGLPVSIEEVAVDDGWTQETAVSIEWGTAGDVGEEWETEEDPDDFDDPEEAVHPPAERGLDDGQGRLAEHYLRTLQFLARNVEAAQAWTARTRRLRRKKAK